MARFIINAGGVVNSVNDDEFNQHIERARQTAMQRQTMAGGPTIAPDLMPREATPDEVAAWYAAQGLTYDAASDTALPAAVAAAASAKSGK